MSSQVCVPIAEGASQVSNSRSEEVLAADIMLYHGRILNQEQKLLLTLIMIGDALSDIEVVQIQSRAQSVSGSDTSIISSARMSSWTLTKAILALRVPPPSCAPHQAAHPTKTREALTQ